MEVRVHRIYNLIPGACGGPPAGTRLVASVQCGDTRFETRTAPVVDGEADFDFAGMCRVTLFARPDGSLESKPLVVIIREAMDAGGMAERGMARWIHGCGRAVRQTHRDPVVGILTVDLADLVGASTVSSGLDAVAVDDQHVPASEETSSAATRDESGSGAVLEGLVVPLERDGKTLLPHVQLTVAATLCVPDVMDGHPSGRTGARLRAAASSRPWRAARDVCRARG